MQPFLFFNQSKKIASAAIRYSYALFLSFSPDLPDQPAYPSPVRAMVDTIKSFICCGSTHIRYISFRIMMFLTASFILPAVHIRHQSARSVNQGSIMPACCIQPVALAAVLQGELGKIPGFQQSNIFFNCRCLRLKHLDPQAVQFVQCTCAYPVYHHRVTSLVVQCLHRIAGSVFMMQVAVSDTVYLSAVSLEHDK